MPSGRCHAHTFPQLLREAALVRQDGLAGEPSVDINIIRVAPTVQGRSTWRWAPATGRQLLHRLLHRRLTLPPLATALTEGICPPTPWPSCLRWHPRRRLPSARRSAAELGACSSVPCWRQPAELDAGYFILVPDQDYQFLVVVFEFLTEEYRKIQRCMI